jgi:hypothetical protein
VAAATAINFSGSGFNVTNTGGGSVLVSSNIVDPFPYTGSAVITGSLTISGSGNNNLFLITLPATSNGDKNKIQINNEGTLVLGKFNTPPTAISGGIFYSSSNEFYLGFA